VETIVVPGGGAGRTVVANQLQRVRGGRDVEIVPVDQDDTHLSQPGLLFVPFGLVDLDRISRPRARHPHHGIRNRVEITDVTPHDGTFSKPVAAAALGGLRGENRVNLITDAVDGSGGHRISYDDHDVPFDLAVVIPRHSGAPDVGWSPGLSDEVNVVPTVARTLQPNVVPSAFVDWRGPLQLSRSHLR
jgi:NADPH-dependent 2,4-dienoyl-CoA reductase/sulfur reductase-like enzyme